jgi:hypothetical protein
VEHDTSWRGIARWVCQINEKTKMDFFVNFKAQKTPLTELI